MSSLQRTLVPLSLLILISYISISKADQITIIGYNLRGERLQVPFTVKAFDRPDGFQSSLSPQVRAADLIVGGNPVTITVAPPTNPFNGSLNVTIAENVGDKNIVLVLAQDSSPPTSVIPIAITDSPTRPHVLHVTIPSPAVAEPCDDPGNCEPIVQQQQKRCFRLLRHRRLRCR